MGAKVEGLRKLKANIRKLEKAVEKQKKTAIKKALMVGAQIVKPKIKAKAPVIGKATAIRAKRTVKNNVRHNIRVNREGNLGVLKIRVRRTGKRRMAPLRANTKDRTDPFYWYLIDQGTKHIKGKHFMRDGFNQAKPRAEKEIVQTAKQILKKPITDFIKK